MRSVEQAASDFMSNPYDPLFRYIAERQTTPQASEVWIGSTFAASVDNLHMARQP